MARLAPVVAMLALLLVPLAVRGELVEYEATFEIVSPSLPEPPGGFGEPVTATGVTERIATAAGTLLPDFQPAFPDNHPILDGLSFLFPVTPAGFVRIGFSELDFSVGKLTLIGGTPAIADPILPIRGSVFFGGTGPNHGPMTQNGTRGAGIGGPAFEVGTLQHAFRFSLAGAPWTVHAASVTSNTYNGPPQVFYSAGFAHGPLSLTSGALGAGGVLQIVTPIQVRTRRGPPGSPVLFDTGFFGRLEVRVLPESGPGLPFLLGAAVLFALGRRRRRRAAAGRAERRSRALGSSA